MSPRVLYIYQIVERDRDPLAIPPRPFPVCKAGMRRGQLPEWLRTDACIGRWTNTNRILRWESTGIRTGRLLGFEKTPATMPRCVIAIEDSKRRAGPHASP